MISAKKEVRITETSTRTQTVENNFFLMDGRLCPVPRIIFPALHPAADAADCLNHFACGAIF